MKKFDKKLLLLLIPIVLHFTLESIIIAKDERVIQQQVRDDIQD